MRKAALRLYEHQIGQKDGCKDRLCSPLPIISITTKTIFKQSADLYGWPGLASSSPG